MLVVGSRVLDLKCEDRAEEKYGLQQREIKLPLRRRGKRALYREAIPVRTLKAFWTNLLSEAHVVPPTLLARTFGTSATTKPMPSLKLSNKGRTETWK